MMRWLRKWRRPDRGWPRYLPGGRIRTTTVAMVIAFAALSWVSQTYQPDVVPAPETAVVPPGFVPDPEYTWVPRTNVRERATSTTSTTTTTTTTTSPTSTSPTSTDEESPTTIVDPDGQGPLTATTVTPTTIPTTPTSSSPEPGTTPTTPPPST